MTKAKVAVIRTKPETVLDDIGRLFELAGGPSALDKSRTTIIKDNISWHDPFPSANTTPWQLEGTILALRENGFRDVVCVQNKTEVTDAFKGEDLNGYKPIFKAHRTPVLFNFRDEDMKWVGYKPKAKMLVLDKIYGEKAPPEKQILIPGFVNVRPTDRGLGERGPKTDQTNPCR